MSKITAKFNRRMSKSFCVKDVTIDMPKPAIMPVWLYGGVERCLWDFDTTRITLKCTGTLSHKNICALRLLNLTRDATALSFKNTCFVSCETIAPDLSPPFLHFLVFECRQMILRPSV